MTSANIRNWIANNWPLMTIALLGSVTFLFWFGVLLHDRLPSPIERNQEREVLIKPVREHSHSVAHDLAEHQAIAGHRVMEERVTSLAEEMRILQQHLEDVQKNFVRKDELPNLVK